MATHSMGAVPWPVGHAWLWVDGRFAGSGVRLVNVMDSAGYSSIQCMQVAANLCQHQMKDIVLHT